MPSRYPFSSHPPLVGQSRTVSWMLGVCIALSACGPGELVPIADAPPVAQSTQASETPPATNTLTPRPTMTATATIVPSVTLIPTESPTLTPEVYPIEPVGVQLIETTIEGVSVGFQIVVDRSLAERKIVPITSFTLADDFIDKYGHTPAEAHAYAAYTGMWYAWKFNNPDQRAVRMDVSFESFMQMVGKEEATLSIYIDNLSDPDKYKPNWTNVDPRLFRGVVLVDKNSGLFKDMSMSIGVRGRAVGLHMLANGEWEIWTHVPGIETNIQNVVINEALIAISVGYEDLTRQGENSPGQSHEDIYDYIKSIYLIAESDRQ